MCSAKSGTRTGLLRSLHFLRYRKARSLSIRIPLNQVIYSTFSHGSSRENIPVSGANMKYIFPNTFNIPGYHRDICHLPLKKDNRHSKPSFLLKQQLIVLMLTGEAFFQIHTQRSSIVGEK